MRFVAVVELPPNAETKSLLPLLEAAYLASRRGHVALIVTNGGADAIDRALDPFVALNRNVSGVVYREAAGVGVWNGADRDTLFIGSSSCVDAAAKALGARCVDSESGISALLGLGADGVSENRTRRVDVATGETRQVHASPLYSTAASRHLRIA